MFLLTALLLIAGAPFVAVPLVLLFVGWEAAPMPIWAAFPDHDFQDRMWFPDYLDTDLEGPLR